MVQVLLYLFNDTLHLIKIRHNATFIPFIDLDKKM